LNRNSKPTPNAPAAAAGTSGGDGQGRVLHADLQSECERMMRDLMRINENDLLVGERTDIIRELHALWAQIGVPGEVRPEELQGVRRRFDVLKREVAAERQAALASWPVLEREYRIERERLIGSEELSDQKAVTYLDASFERARARKDAAGEYLHWHDISSLAVDMAQDRHTDRGWSEALVQTLRDREGHAEDWRLHWPPLKFKIAQLAIKNTSQSLTPFVRDRVQRNVQSAIRYQIRKMSMIMIRQGLPEEDVIAWAKSAHAHASKSAAQLAQQTLLVQGAGKVTHLLHVAGKLTIVIDVGASLIEVVAVPLEEKPRLVVMHAARILGGYAGAKTGASLGLRWGARFGPEGELVCGLIGGFAGGFWGAWAARTVAISVVDEVLPPEATYIETIDSSSETRSR
jgi:hypothetical protein